VSELSMHETESFLAYLDEWLSTLPILEWQDLEREAGSSDNIALLCVDLTNAFARHGNLASPRVAALIDPIVRLFRLAHARGVRTFILPQDCHPPGAPEFEQYGPHAMAGSDEPETVQELKDLPFSDLYRVMCKSSVNPGVNAEFAAWLEREGVPPVSIVTGDCTDICVYQLAMHLKVSANERLQKRVVIVPRDCVDTYDVDSATAKARGIIPHPGELMHRIFLYHMMLNGIRIVQRIE
jgi:nicotinamidase-related amidase